MVWVAIDSDLCTGCGSCVTICPRACFTLNDEVAEAQADETNCSRCGHCVCICPPGAITHNQMAAEEFIELDDNDDIDTEQLVRFIRKRRSHRNFQDDDVPWEVLAKLLDVCRYVPTGTNCQTVEIHVITDRQKIHRLSELALDFYRQNLLQAEKKAAELKASGKEIPPELVWVLGRAHMVHRHEAFWEAGRDPILRGAPAVLIFHSTPDASTPKDDCVIAAHTVALTAMTMGLETCYIGLLEKAVRGSAAVMEALHLPVGNKVYIVLVVGYPKFQFARTVARKPFRTTWE